MKKGLLITLLAAGAVTFAGCIHKVCCFHSNPEKIIRKIVKHMDRKLTLTSVQQESLTDALRVLMNEHKAMKVKHSAFKDKFHEQFISEDFNSELVKNEFNEELIQPGLINLSTALKDLHRTLSPDQRRELVRLFEKRHRCFRHN